MRRKESEVASAQAESLGTPLAALDASIHRGIADAEVGRAKLAEDGHHGDRHLSHKNSHTAAGTEIRKSYARCLSPQCHEVTWHPRPKWEASRKTGSFSAKCIANTCLVLVLSSYLKRSLYCLSCLMDLATIWTASSRSVS